MPTSLQFAVLQKEPDGPTVDQLKRAFSRFSHLTDADAVRVATGTRGILMRHLDQDLARAFQQALQAEGVGAAIVAESNLPKLPEPLSLTRADLWPQALTIYDPFGRPVSVAWEDIILVAAGAAQSVESYKTQTEFLRLLRQTVSETLPPGTAAARRVESRLCLDILAARGDSRYEIDAAQFNFKSVIDRPGLTTAEKFIWLVREMCHHAGRAALNRGAQRLRDGEKLVPEYPTRQILTDEMVWILWHRAREAR